MVLYAYVVFMARTCKYSTIYIGGGLEVLHGTGGVRHGQWDGCVRLHRFLQGLRRVLGDPTLPITPSMVWLFWRLLPRPEASLECLLVCITLKSWPCCGGVIWSLGRYLSRYEIDDCTAFGPCSTRGITPARLLVCGEQISRQRGETAREPQLPDHSKDPGNYKLNTASAKHCKHYLDTRCVPVRPGTRHGRQVHLIVSSQTDANI